MLEISIGFIMQCVETCHRVEQKVKNIIILEENGKTTELPYMLSCVSD